MLLYVIQCCEAILSDQTSVVELPSTGIYTIALCLCCAYTWTAEVRHTNQWAVLTQPITEGLDSAGGVKSADVSSLVTG